MEASNSLASRPGCFYWPKRGARPAVRHGEPSETIQALRRRIVGRFGAARLAMARAPRAASTQRFLDRDALRPSWPPSDRGPGQGDRAIGPLIPRRVRRTRHRKSSFAEFGMMSTNRAPPICMGEATFVNNRKAANSRPS
jgi:hypothetical protein